jgi:hypothetical protein
VPEDTSLDPDDWDIPDDGSFDTDVDEVDPSDFPDVAGGDDGGGDTLDPGGDPTGNNPPDPLAPQAPETLGPMQRCPIPGGPAAVPPDELCAGAVVTRRLANIGDEGNAIVETGGEELYSIPLTPPEALGGDDWNGKSVTFSFVCPDGTSQPADPCESPRPRDGTYDVSGRGAVTITLLINRNGTRSSCSGSFVNTFTPTSSTGTFTGISSITVEGIDYTYNESLLCGHGQTYYSGPGVYIRSGGSTLISRLPGLVFILFDEWIYSESIDVTVEFADAPGVQVPIENLTRLS